MMSDFVLFGHGWLHRAGHFVAATAACLFFLLAWPRPDLTLVAWVLGCEVLPRFLEALDLYAGGFVVTWEQRKRIWQAARSREFRITQDTLNDLWEYRVAWLLYPLAALVWGF